MRPPICAVCGKKILEESGGLVYFRKRPADIEWDKRMEDRHMAGHPPYAEWFCEEHFTAARNYSDLTRDKAMPLIRLESGKGHMKDVKPFA